MTIDLFIPILRQILQIVGGILIARGYFDQGMADALVASASTSSFSVGGYSTGTRSTAAT